MPKIVLRGYYGFGNLGDDILMLSSLHWIDDIFDSYDLFICTESNHPAYILNWINEAKLINISSNIESDWIIQGGGGIYFDFLEGSKTYAILNRFIKLIGFKRFLKSYKLYKNLSLRPGLRSKYRAGLGIGVGTFTSTSKKFYSSTLTLADYNILFVRDSQSVLNISKYKFNYPIYRSTDLAFSSDGWLSLSSNNKHRYDGPKRIAFILRDWPYNNNKHIDDLLKVADHLSSHSYSVKFYSFDERADQKYIEQVKHKYDLTTWKPEKMSMNTFLSELSQNHVVISSRAHGAIVSACLGIPGICINIEPKLKTVANMLPKSYSLHSSGSDKLIDSVIEIFNNYSYYSEQTNRDVAHNRDVLLESKEAFKNFVTQLK